MRTFTILRAADFERHKVLHEHKPRNAEQQEDHVWGNEATLAGEFKIAEAAPALARRIDVRTSGEIGFGERYNFSEYDAPDALVRIGAPAVPVVIQLLKGSNPLRREMAAYVLRYIGTSDASHALEDALPGEKDPKVRHRIQEALDSRRR